jgi:hypothetical protein
MKRKKGNKDHVDKVNRERSRRVLEKYKGRVALHLHHYNLISHLKCSWSQGFSLGFWLNPSTIGLVSVVQHPP